MDLDLPAEVVLKEDVRRMLLSMEGWRRLFARLGRTPARGPGPNEAARLYGRARTTFYRHFKEWTGWGWAKFVRIWRLVAGRRLLERYPSAKVHAIALAVGYRSGRAFSSAFKRHFGQAPRAQRTLFD